MEAIEEKARKDAKEIYSKYLLEGLTDEISKEAKKVYDEYLPVNSLLSETINKIIGKLFPLAYKNTNSKTKLPTKEEIKEILQLLKT